jgi:hypothetical protein
MKAVKQVLLTVLMQINPLCFLSGETGLAMGCRSVLSSILVVVMGTALMAVASTRVARAGPGDIVVPSVSSADVGPTDVAVDTSD